MTDLGALALWVAALMAVWGAALSFAGITLGRDDLAHSGRRGLVACAGFVAIATAALWWAFLADDFAVRQVAMFSSVALPSAFKLSASWTARAGSLLLFALAFAVLAAGAQRANRDGNERLMPGVTATCALVLVVALVILVTTWNPLERIETVLEDGRGLDPRLQGVAAAATVPLRLLGYAAAAVALAFALVAAVQRRYDGACRRALGWWTLIAWCFSSASVLVALRAAYTNADYGTRWFWRATDGASLDGGAALFVAVAAALGALIAGTLLNGGVRRIRGSARYALVAGSACLAAGLAASALRSQQVLEIADGATVHLADPLRRDWSFTSQGASRIERPGQLVAAVALRAAQGKERPQFITTEYREYFGQDDRERFPPLATTGTGASLLEDVAVTYVSGGEGTATLRVTFVPLVSWVWIGGVAIVIGAALAIRPAASSSEEVA
ncbi:MAG: hypothetical protein ACHQQ3_02750 [Gemmatimonadales bacterium]